MKQPRTFQEKAIALLEQSIVLDGLHLSQEDKLSFVNRVIGMLQLQDRDTKAACAMSIEQLEDENDYTETFEKLVNANDAKIACYNAKM